MAIIPRARPEVAPIRSLPQVRETTTVRAPTGLTQAASQFAGVSMDIVAQQQKKRDDALLLQSRKSLSDFDNSIFDPENPDGIEKYKGADALKADDELPAQLNTQIGKIRSDLPTHLQPQFDEIAFNYSQNFGDRVRRTSVQRNEEFVQFTEKSTIEQIGNDQLAAFREGDIDRADQLATEGATIYAGALERRGIRGEEAKFELQKFASGMHKARILDAVVDRPKDAMEYLDRYGDRMTAEDRADAEAKVRPYVVDDQARDAVAQVWHSGVGTEGAGVARLDKIEDPDVRKAAKAEFSRQWSQRQQDRVEQERLAIERMRVKIGQSDGTQSLEQALGPADLAFARRKGWLDSLGRQFYQGALIETDPRIYDRFARLAVTNPAEFAKPETKLAIEESADKLGTDDLGRLQDMWADANDPKKRESAKARWATEAQQLSMAFDSMGIDGAKNAEKQHAFRTAFHNEKRAWIEANKGVAPDADQTQAIINRLKLPFVKSGWFSDTTRRAFEGPEEGFDVPDSARTQIIDAFRAAGIPKPSENDIRAAYMRGAGSNL